MRTLRHGWRLSAILIAIALGTGCRWGGNPYANDPLMQPKRTVPGGNLVPEMCDRDHPLPPTPPIEEVPAPFVK
jgi:hypothetical protein